MSVIRSVAQQWNKADFAQQLQLYFAQDKAIGELFVGATPCSTVCSLIAAMIELPPKPKNEHYSMDMEQVFDTLFQCFLLMFIKELEHKLLTQPEQLIMSLAVHYAQTIRDDAQYANSNLQDNSQRVLTAMARLESERKQQRKQQYNMGKC
ncbi:MULTISPECIES: hypothetical protein [unclassified Shewanella]|uniref:hypothetical protein n=1 Tax=unclassified Shewanella TaxID=196818 RepID=UPI000C81A9CE|nr:MULTISPECIES: hypothetical protein [unclassified Shewanella]MDO6774501.1 hypothetical protein [Shewanella sp. 3_MG-2023]PMG29850.1 hypothetical protein BCU94_12545 [Shewanella sp. 10N.286.52.C2]PMH86194.1 hypothetical protein BCU57_11945 [Shewanella sp. 10N.286.48.B5]PMH99033.1 hypothetical protein BCU55_02255 [Shewanella sp. 10N.286.48.A6]